MIKIILINLIVLFFISSCAFHQGSISSTQLISNQKIQYVDMAIGKAKAEYIFGIGGLSKDALVLEAKRTMMAAKPLQFGQAYINVTVDFKKSYYFFYSKNQVIVSADIIEIAPDSSSVVFSSNYQQSLSKNKVFTLNSLNLNDDVLIHTGGKIIEAQIREFHVRSATLVYYSKSGGLKAKEFPLILLYKSTDLDKISPHKDVKVNDIIEYLTMENGSIPITRAGIVKGANHNSYLLELKPGKYVNVLYSAVKK